MTIAGSRSSRAFGLSLLLAMTIVGCKTAAPPAALARAGSGSAVTGTAVVDPVRGPLVWSVTKQGKTTYLLGTMHVGIDADTHFPAWVWSKFDAAPIFAMETNVNDPSLSDLARKDGGTLHKDLGDAYWTKLEAALTAPVATYIDAMKPMVAATLLSLKGLPKTPPMDGVFHDRAVAQKKQMVYLEPASKQAALLEKWMDVRALKLMLDNLDAATKQTLELLDAYIAGDAFRITAIGEVEREAAKKSGYTDKELDEQADDMLYNRNASWIAAIEQLHGSGNGFIAVGAMHLLGKKNVLEMLAAKGYTVARVTP